MAAKAKNRSAGRVRQANQRVQQGKTTSSLAKPGPASKAVAANTVQPGPMEGPQIPRVDPFLSGNDLTSLAQFRFDDTSTRADIDRALSDLTAQTALDRQRVNDSTLRNTTGTVDNMAARGLFQSSIKDGAIADIEKNRALQQGQLDARLRIAGLDADARIKALNDKARDYQLAANQQAVDNARSVNDQNAAAAAPPAEPPPVKPLQQPQQAAAKPQFKPVVKDGKFYHVYPDGRFVYIRPASKR